MYQAKVYIDFDAPGVLHEATRAFDQPFSVLEEEVHDDGTITFVVDTRGHRDAFAERMADAPEVSEVDRLDDDRLLVRKDAKGATVAIRENHGKFNGIDKFHGTKRVFEVLLLRRDDLRGMVEDLRALGDVRIGSLVEMTGRPDVLSDRQYEAVQTALELGYFDWPREADAETLAEALGVSHATALEHLRKGERKLLTRALSDVTARTTQQDREFLLTSRTRRSV
jgi:predicted DNA binding protein